MREAETKAGFTPGPWEFHPLRGRDGLGYIRPRDEDGREIAHHGDEHRSEAENLANAHLIAAAPAMYEALKAVEAWIMDPWTESDVMSDSVLKPFRDALLATRAALRQAEGR